MKFNLQKFINDMKQHRIQKPKTSYKKASESIGIGEITVYNICHGISKDPSFEIVLRCCDWMGKSCTDYIN